MNINMPHVFASLALIASTIFSTPSLLAQPGGPGGPGGFGGPDRKLVEQFDADKSGWLNAEERKAAREFQKKNPTAGGRGPGGGVPGGRFGAPSFADPLIKALDSDKDSQLSAKELEAGIASFFTTADAKKSGTIDQEAFGQALNAIIPPPPGAPAGPGGPGGPGGSGGGRRFGAGTFLAPAIMTKADANKDEKLTNDELNASAKVIFKEADKDKNEKLDATELNAGIATLMPARGPGGPGGGGLGGPGGPGGGSRDLATPGVKVSPESVKSFPDAAFYEPTVLRTIFIDFDNTADWEAELAEFKPTDVEVTATMIVDGKTYPNVGISFRGASSFGMIPAGYKRSLNVSMDLVDSKQRLYGYKSLNLLNGNGDPAMLSSVLYSHIARQYIPAPKANLVKVVINGENWGIYANVQQFNKEFLTENYKPRKGARWKAPGSPNGSSGLEYLGDNIADYKARYEIKSKDDDADWKALIELCRVLNKTPALELEAALKPILNIDGLLWFLALDVGLINSDGYWTRASDYSIYRDDKGVFHILPHDMNESFRGAGGPGGPGGPGGRGGAGGEVGGSSPVGLDPLVALTDARKPLRSKILAVPALRERYLKCVKTLAQDGLDWNKLGPVVAQYRALIQDEVKAETRKLSTYDAFLRATDPAPAIGAAARSTSLRTFADQRRAFLLEYAEIKKLDAAKSR